MIEVEPVRIVPVVLQNGLRRHRGAINGLVESPRLNRAVDNDLTTIPLREGGIVLAQALADILTVRPGDLLTVEVREGRRPTLFIPVAGVANTLLGAPAYMQRESLNRVLKEPNRLSAAYLRIDSAQRSAIYRTLKEMPAVAGVSLKSDTRAALQKQMDTGAGAMRFIMAAIADQELAETELTRIRNLRRSNLESQAALDRAIRQALIAEGLALLQRRLPSDRRILPVPVPG